MPYDLTRHEDLFACIDALTRASAALSATDTELAHELTRIIDALARFADRSGGEEGRPAPAAATAGNVLDDLLGGPGRPKPTRPAAEDEIIDVLTGKKVG